MFCHLKRSPGIYTLIPSYLFWCLVWVCGVCTCLCLRVLGVSVAYSMLQRSSALPTSPAVSDTWGLLNGFWFNKWIRLFSNSPGASFCCCLCLFLFLFLRTDCGFPSSPPSPPHASLCLNHKVIAIPPHLHAEQSVTSLVAAGTSALVYSVISGHQLPI